MKRITIVALVVFAVATVAVLFLGPRQARDLQAGFLQGLSPFLKTGSGLQVKISALTEKLKTLQELEAANLELRTENGRLKTSNDLLRDIEEENARLRNALGYKARTPFKLLPAHVIAREASTWWNTVKIDRGFQDGIKGDMAVITPEGLVGKTTTVARDVSVVVLISDESCKVASAVQGSRERGIVSGDRLSSRQQALLTISFLSRDADLRNGQRVVTAGVGGVFPQGLAVGVVQAFQKRELDGKATMTPSADLGRLEEVFVVVGGGRP